MKSKNFELVKLYSDTGLVVIKSEDRYLLKNTSEITLGIEKKLKDILNLMEKRYYGDPS